MRVDRARRTERRRTFHFNINLLASRSSSIRKSKNSNVKSTADFPEPVILWEGRRMEKLVATAGELIGLGRDGRVYGWPWSDERPSNNEHESVRQLIQEADMTEGKLAIETKRPF